jgi:hypothetical protein
MLQTALLLGLAVTGATLLVRLVVGDLFGRLDWLAEKPLGCDGCCASWLSLAGLFWLHCFSSVPWPASVLCAGASIAITVLLLRLKLRLEV